MARIHSCNVLSAGEARRDLWRFVAGDGRLTAAGQKSAALGEALPAKWVGKGWTHLWQPALNVAWLPADKVFIRVLQLPPCEPAELPAMVEFQIEKISPWPVAQIVWCLERVHRTTPAPDGTQTVIVLVAARNVVEEHLGRLEEAGFQADRLELPLVHELFRVSTPNDTAWVYPRSEGGHHFCLVAWSCGGALRHVSVLQLTAEANWRNELREQVTKVAWAGELEGWLGSALEWRLVATEAQAAVWLPLVEAVVETPVQVVAPLSPAELAAASANHAAQSGTAALLPGDNVVRYHQQFVDRLWMRGLGVAGLAYLAVVVVYLIALQVRQFQLTQLESQTRELNPQNLKALQLKEKYAVVENQVNLRYAALESWKAVALHLPEGLSITDLTFEGGQRLAIRGVSDGDPVTKVLDLKQALTEHQLNGRPLFRYLSPESVSRGGAGGQWQWNFHCDLGGVGENP